MPVMSAFGYGRHRRRPVNTWGIPLNYSYDDIKENEPMKKFYVGAKHIGASIQHGSNADCTRETLDQAINDAQQQIRDGAQCVVVVKIVAVVRRDFPPISVELID